MKIQFYISSFILLLTMTTSCSNDDSVDAASLSNVEVHFNSNIHATKATKASDNQWNTNDKIGVFMVKNGQPLAEANIMMYADNIEYNASTTGTSTSFTPTGATIYYPQSGTVDFKAYYPHIPKGTNAGQLNNYVFPIDVTNQANSTNLDLLYSNNATAHEKNSPSVTLNFVHMMTKMRFIVQKGEGMTNQNFAGMTVTISGMNTNADFNLATTTFANQRNVQNIDASPVIDGTEYSAILISTASTSSCKVDFTINGKTYTWDMPDGTALQSGKINTFTIRVTKTNITVETNITNWDTTTPPTVIGTDRLFEVEEIPAGIFWMGSPTAEVGRTNASEQRHLVYISKNFYIGKYEVTNAQYCTFLNSIGIGADAVHTSSLDGTSQILIKESTKTNGGIYNWGINYVGNKWIPAAGFDSHPVVYVTWYGSYEFAHWAGGRLPTDAEWEYACRGGLNDLPYGIGDGTTLYSNMANFDGTRPYDPVLLGFPVNNYGVPNNAYLKKTTPIRHYSSYANGYGLYDMHGNVREWVNDWYAGNYGLTHTELDDLTIDPQGPATGSTRVVRGGNLELNAVDCRSASRFYFTHNTSQPTRAFAYNRGFRIAIDKP